jgi:hypothetical protein
MVLRARKILTLSAILAVPVIAAEPAQSPALMALNALETGQWALKAANPGESRQMCVTDPRLLLQVRHGRAQCSRFVISNDARTATVHYTCPGQGHGRTTVRVETPRLVQIDSQGIADNEPFAIRMEGRRIGGCGTQTGALSR